MDLTIGRTAAELHPAAIVLAALTPQPFEAVSDEIAALARDAPVLIDGEGADHELAKRFGAEALEPDPVRAGLQLARTA